MKTRSFAAISVLALAACGGGGSSAPQPQIVQSVVQAPAATGAIPMSISFPRRTPSGRQRSPQFISPGSAAIAIYDGSTLVYVANLSLDSQSPFQTLYAKSAPPTTIAPGTCTFGNTVTCTLTITSTIGAHKFDFVLYPTAQGQQGPAPAPESSGRAPQDTGTPPTFTGVISTEGELSVTLIPGANPAATVTLLGVADKVLFAGLSEAAYNDTVTYGFRIEDSTNSQIIQPGTAYDNGPVTVTASPAGFVTITPSSFATPPASVGDQNFTVQCINTAGGAVTISFNTKTSPNTAYASGLTYSTSNYSGAVIQTIPFTCDAATATIPITIDGRRR